MKPRDRVEYEERPAGNWPDGFFTGTIVSVDMEDETAVVRWDATTPKEPIQDTYSWSSLRKIEKG